MDLIDHVPRPRAAAPAHARAPRRWCDDLDTRPAARGRRRRRDRHALAVRGADRRRAAGDASRRIDAHGRVASPRRSPTSPSPTSSALGPTSTSSRSAASRRPCRCPVIASLNGTTAGGWLELRAADRAGRRRRARAERLLRRPPTRTRRGAVDRARTLDDGARRSKRGHASRWRSSSRRSTRRSPHFATQLDEAGADGLVLFNRFYQPDIDIEELEVRRASASRTPPSCCCGCAGWRSSRAAQGLARRHRRRAHRASTRSRRSWPAPTRCRWSRPCCSTARTTCELIRDDLARWLEEHEYESLDADARQHEPRALPRPAGFERANYMKILQSWKPAW